MKTMSNEEIVLKETALFNHINESYLNSLIYLELEDDHSNMHRLHRLSTSNSMTSSTTTLDLNDTEDQLLNEIFLKDKLNQNELILPKIQHFYVLHGNRSILITIRTESIENQNGTQSTCNEIADLLVTYFNICGVNLIHKPLPSTLVLVSEITEKQLNILSSDKSDALKLIESKTGLRLKKIKKSFYFTGLLFQFVLLNNLINEHENKQSKSLALNNNSIQNPDWMSYYTKSEIKYKFKIKPLHVDDFAYDVYIFNADLTDLNTDAIVNASNASLHPGYVGDGISRRIREKAGKQMQEALKKYLLSSQNKLNDSDLVLTKSYGKLKSKYVLHSVAPTWSKYVLNKYQIEKFEPLVEKMFTNIITKAHDISLDIRSIAFPVSSTSTGGAFDIPLELLVHILYCQLAFFKPTPEMNLKFDKICLCSVETNTCKQLCDLLTQYSEMCMTTSWGIPNSPMSKLVQQLYPDEDFDLLINKNTYDIQDNSQDKANYCHNSSDDSESSGSPTDKKELDPKTSISGSSQNSTGMTSANPIPINNTKCCLFCQNEKNLLTCGNNSCNGAYCSNCIMGFLSKQTLKRCPGCKSIINNRSVLTNIKPNINNGTHPNAINNTSTSFSFSSTSSSSSSLSISPVRFNNVAATRRSNNENNFNIKDLKNSNNLNIYGHVKYPVCDAKIFIRKLDEPCDGYENFKSVLVTFEIEDGIQNVIKIFDNN